MSNNVGFIGLGNMGNGMANNLIAKGKNVVVFDVNKDAAKGLKGDFKMASSPKEVADSSDVVVTMLPNNDIVKDVYEGADGVFKGSKANFYIDSSTIDPAVSKALAANANFIDAPVSGGVNAANAGTLTFMVGANSDADFNKAKDVLSLMGANVTHCGDVGSGQAVKICNNMLLAVSMIGVSETMNLGKSLGLDPKLLTQVLSSATGRCWSVDTYNPVPGVMENVPSSNGYKGGFGTALMAKDLGLAQDAATRVKAAAPLGSLAHQMYRLMCESGYAGRDFSSVYEFLNKGNK